MSRAPSGATGRHPLAVALVAILAVVTAVSGLGLALGTTAGPAIAAEEHHAGVVVDTGAGVHVEVVTFTEDSISGLEALQRAGADPTVLGFAGMGGAVCSLYGVGHPATNGACLGEASDPRFWAYWHVPSGRAGFDQSTFSRAGASTVRVHDGDVDGWRFGTGEPPAWPAISLPDTPPATAAPSGPTGSAAGGGAAGGGGGGGTGGVGGVPTGPGGSNADPSTTGPTPSTLSREAWAAIAALKAAASTTTSTTSTTRPAAGSKHRQAETEVAAERASATHDSGGGGSALSIAAFVAVLVLLAGGVLLARRARVGRSSGPS